MTASTIAPARKPSHCLCGSCGPSLEHASDCAVHNEPAYPKGPCDCGVTAAYIAAIYREVKE